MFRVWLVLHVVSAVALFGSSFAFPFVGVVIKKGGDPKTGIKLIQTVAHRLLLPADILMPLTGALMIASSHGAYNPLHRENRWLLSGIILFAILVVVSQAVQMPITNRAVKLAEAGDTGPEFQALVKKSGKIGPFLGVLIIAILVLMAGKPSL